MSRSRRPRFRPHRKARFFLIQTVALWLCLVLISMTCTGLTQGEVVALRALTHLGKPYVLGAAGPDKFDCSGLVMYCLGPEGFEFPVHAAALIGTDEGTVLARLRELKAAGFLRRIGTFFDSNRLGYQGTLVALKVKPSELDTVAEAVNRYPGATHNYEREDVYNLWFTLLTPNQQYESNILAEIRSLRGVEDMLRLKANKKYKINVQFKLK